MLMKIESWYHFLKIYRLFYFMEYVIAILYYNIYCYSDMKFFMKFIYKINLSEKYIIFFLNIFKCV